MAIKTQRQVIYGVQYLRGLAALGVLFCHYGSEIKGHPILSSIFNFGQTGVFLFFLISGFIIVYSLTVANYKVTQFFNFLLKRSIRIDPPYLATIAFTFALFYVLSLVPTFKGNAIPFVWQQLLAHIFYVVPFTGYQFYNHVFWTLCVEFQFYLFIGLLYFIVDSKIYKNYLLIAFGLSCLIPFTNYYYLIFTYAPIFCLGISLVSFYMNRASRYDYGLVILFLLLIAYKFSFNTFALLLISAFVMLFIKMRIKPLFILGDISYSLYLTHSLTAIVVSGLLKRLHADLAKNQLLWLGFEVAIAISVAYLFYLAIERPSLRLSKRIFYKSKP